jgi:hypothetical protein
MPRIVAVVRARLTELALESGACFVALEGERWIGYTVLDMARSTTERLHQSWTGVLPAYRQRRIGTALKPWSAPPKRRRSNQEFQGDVVALQR